MDEKLREYLNNGVIETLIGNKSVIGIYSEGDYENFEKECWTNFSVFIRSYSGKLQLIRYNYENINNILDYQLKSKNVSEAHKFYEKIKQDSYNALYSSLLLDSHSLYLQMLEQFFGLIFSLNENKKSNLFWMPFIFCDYGGNKNNREIKFKPKNLYSKVESFYTQLFDAKDKIKFLKNNLDLEYVFFASHKFDFLLDNKQKKEIFKKILNKITMFLMHFSNKDAYNAWKHRSRTFTGSLPMKLKFDLKDGSSISTPLQNICLFWYDADEKNITKNYTQSDIKSNIDAMETLLTAIFETIKCHGVKFSDSFVKAYENDPYRIEWLD